MTTSTQLQFIHYDLGTIGPESLVEISLTGAANVQLMDAGSFEKYKAGGEFRYHGGHVTRSPYRLRPPRTDHWHLTIDLGGAAGAVRSSVRVLPARQVA